MCSVFLLCTTCGSPRPRVRALVPSSRLHLCPFCPPPRARVRPCSGLPHLSYFPACVRCASVPSFPLPCPRLALFSAIPTLLSGSLTRSPAHVRVHARRQDAQARDAPLDARSPPRPGDRGEPASLLEATCTACANPAPLFSGLSCTRFSCARMHALACA